MPIFKPDPSKVSASIEILEKDDYEFTIGEPRAFFRKNRNQQDSYGIRFPLTVAEGRKKGTKIFISLYQQSEGAQSMAKQFMIAAYGFPSTREGEKAFDAQFAGSDWGFDTDVGACGEAWKGPVGKRIIGSLDVGISETGEQQQQFKKWRALTA